VIDPIKDEAMKWIEVHRQKLQSDLLVRILDFESKHPRYTVQSIDLGHPAEGRPVNYLEVDLGYLRDPVPDDKITASFD
jgi:hypothetical protein